MEKRKVFKISIIDKEISRTEFDRNTFYTSDSELTLVFKLIEKDYTYEQGEILLYNEVDKSFVTRKITKEENNFIYEIESDIIPHYGTWKAQLQLVNDGDVYTSKPFEFSIVNDLSNLAPQPTLTDINNWSTLKKNAAELIDEMKNVIDDIKKAESQHENAERIRQNQENSRVQSESERQSQERLRSQGESQRQSQENKRVESENERILKEIERNKNESNRQTIFENNEVRRKETFNANESTRQENETTRQQAELVRVDNEKQRKIDHANRSAQFDGKADKVVLKNLIANGDFSKGFDGWEVKGDVQNIGGRVKLVRLTGGPLASLSYQNREIFERRNDVYYMLVQGELINRISGADGVMINDTVNVLPVWLLRNQPNGVVSNSSIVFNLSPNNTPYVYANTVGGSEYFIDNIIIVNLTKTFGKGNEPTKEEMDELIKITGYIDGEYALNNKEMLIWTITLIRRNRNAIVALGGA